MQPPANRLLRRVAGMVVVVTVAATGVAVYAVSTTIDSPATVSQRADRRDADPGDVVAVYDYGEVDRAVVDGAEAAARQVGGFSAAGRTGSLGMRRIVRNGTTVHAPPSGYLIPTVYTALPRDAMDAVMGSGAASAVDDHDRVVMNAETAEMTGAEVGDIFQMQAADGSMVPLTIAAIRPRTEVGSSELVMTTAVAATLGATQDTRMLIWGFESRAAIDRALEDVGLADRRDTRASRSWDPPDPDSTLSTLSTKQLTGEAWYRFESDGSISMHPTWLANNLTPGRITLNSSIPIRARCHVAVVDDLRAALAEVADAGRAAAIDVDNANTYGGCYAGARFSRFSGQIGFLSRHSYGQALDINTVTNCQGCRPPMDCTVVRIFRKHGFAWGGNFRKPDGMHFEWVGEPRDQIADDSRYCPNLVSSFTEQASSATIGADVVMVDAGDAVADAGHDHDHDHDHGS